MVNNGQQCGKSVFRLHRSCLHTSDHASCHSLAITVLSSAPERGQQSRDGRWPILHISDLILDLMLDPISNDFRSDTRSGIRIMSDLISDLIDIRSDTRSDIEADIVADIGCIR